MSENKHTPGPWTAVFHDMHNPEDINEGIRDFYTIRDKRNCYIVNVGRVDKATYQDGQHAANARLIAAAPLLLAACVKACTYMVEDIAQVGWLEIEVAEQLQAAIDAAEGESNA